MRYNVPATLPHWESRRFHFLLIQESVLKETETGNDKKKMINKMMHF